MSRIATPDKISKIDNGNTLFYRDDILLKAMPEDSLVVLGENNYTIKITNLQDDSFIFNIEDVATLDYHGIITTITPANLKNVQGLITNLDVIFKELTDKYFGRGGDSIPVSDLRENVAYAIVSTWTLDTGTSYYYDFKHNLGSLDLFWSFLNLADNKHVRVEEIEYLSNVTARIYVKGNTHKLRISVSSGLVGAMLTNRTPYHVYSDVLVAIRQYVIAHTSGTDITVTLPSILSVGFIDVTHDGLVTDSVYIDPDGNDINGSSSVVRLFQKENLTLFCDGTQYYIQ